MGVALLRKTNKSISSLSVEWVHNLFGKINGVISQISIDLKYEAICAATSINDMKNGFAL